MAGSSNLDEVVKRIPGQAEQTSKQMGIRGGLVAAR